MIPSTTVYESTKLLQNLPANQENQLSNSHLNGQLLLLFRLQLVSSDHKIACQTRLLKVCHSCMIFLRGTYSKSQCNTQKYKSEAAQQYYPSQMARKTGYKSPGRELPLP